eukprot:1690045-Rhodomonas_salina.1
MPAAAHLAGGFKNRKLVGGAARRANTNLPQRKQMTLPSTQLQQFGGDSVTQVSRLRETGRGPHARAGSRGDLRHSAAEENRYENDFKFGRWSRLKRFLLHHLYQGSDAEDPQWG